MNIRRRHSDSPLPRSAVSPQRALALSSLLFTLAACPVLALASQPETPHFDPVDVSSHVYDGQWEHFVGGGVAAFDCDGDQLPELYAAGGENPAQLFRNTSADKLSFSVATPASLALKGVVGAYPLDIDSDGALDLVVLRVGPDLLLRGNGHCGFAPFESLGFAAGDYWSTAFSATWEGGNALPTLAFGSYVDRSDPAGPFEVCDPTLVYRPEGNRYHEPQLLEPGYCALSMLFSDWGRSGRADLRVSNDRHYYVRGGQEQLWAMGAEPSLYSEEQGWLHYSLWGMGIASRDITGDGYPEIYLTSMGDQKLQVFDPTATGPVWRNDTYQRGATAHRPHTGGDGRPSTGWHAQFGDVNNDGLDDLFVAKGNVEQMPVAAMEDPNNLLLQQPSGAFVEAAAEAGVASMARSRGAALMDLNNDGYLDLAVLNRRADLQVYANQHRAGNWLLVDLIADAPNRSAVGSFIEIKTVQGLQTREVTVGGGHASGQAGFQHFGLGDAGEVELRVIWPQGAVGDWQTMESNQTVQLRRP